MATKKLSIAMAALAAPSFTNQVTFLGGFKISATAVTASGAEMNYLVGVTSAIQTQLNAKLASASYTAADVLSKMLTVDGASSGLDADLLDGQHGAYYAPIASPTFSGTVTGTFAGNLTGNVTGNLSGTATNAQNLTTTNYTITQESGKLVVKYGTTTVLSINTDGSLVTNGELTDHTTP